MIGLAEILPYARCDYRDRIDGNRRCTSYATHAILLDDWQKELRLVCEDHVVPEMSNSVMGASRRLSDYEGYRIDAEARPDTPPTPVRPSVAEMASRMAEDAKARLKRHLDGSRLDYSFALKLDEQRRAWRVVAQAWPDRDQAPAGDQA